MVSTTSYRLNKKSQDSHSPLTNTTEKTRPLSQTSPTPKQKEYINFIEIMRHGNMIKPDALIKNLGEIDLREFDPTNYLALQILEQLDSLKPTQKEIDHVEKLIKKIVAQKIKSSAT